MEGLQSRAVPVAAPAGFRRPDATRTAPLSLSLGSYTRVTPDPSFRSACTDCHGCHSRLLAAASRGRPSNVSRGLALPRRSVARLPPKEAGDETANSDSPTSAAAVRASPGGFCVSRRAPFVHKRTRFGLPGEPRIQLQVEGIRASSHVLEPTPSAPSFFSMSHACTRHAFLVCSPPLALSNSRKRCSLAALLLALLCLRLLSCVRLTPSLSGHPRGSSIPRTSFSAAGRAACSTGSLSLASPHAPACAASSGLLLLASAQDVPDYGDEGEWVDDESFEEEDAEEFSDEDPDDDDLNAATHRVYHLEDRYYRAIPLADARQLLAGLRAHSWEPPLSAADWAEIEDEIGTQLELIDRRMFPQTFFESVTESEAFEPGALLTNLGGNEMTEEAARALEIEKTAEVLRAVIGRRLSKGPAAVGSSSSKSESSAAPADASSPKASRSEETEKAKQSSQTPASAPALSSAASLPKKRPSPSGGRASSGAAPNAAPEGAARRAASPEKIPRTEVAAKTPSGARAAAAPGQPAKASNAAAAAPEGALGGSGNRTDAARASQASPGAASSSGGGGEASSQTSAQTGAASGASSPAAASAEKQGEAAPKGVSQKGVELGADAALNLGGISFRPSDYIDLILRAAKPAKFRDDSLSRSRGRGKRTRVAGGTASAKPEAPLGSAETRGTGKGSSPASAGDSQPRMVRDFGELYLLLRGLMTYSRDDLQPVDLLPPPAADLFSPHPRETGSAASSSASGTPHSGGDGPEGAQEQEREISPNALLLALRQQLDGLSLEAVRKLRAEAKGACAFLSFFGIPDAEGKLQLPGGWPRDIALAMRCVVEGNRSRQLCGTCFLIDGLATALGFPPLLTGSDAWAVAQEPSVKSLFVLHRLPETYAPPDLRAESPTHSPNWNARPPPRAGETPSDATAAQLRLAGLRALRSNFDAPLIKYEMAGQMGDTLGKLAAAYYLRTGLGVPDYRYTQKQGIDQPQVPEELFAFARGGRVRMAQVSIERLPTSASGGCFAALKHVLSVGSEATEQLSFSVTPRYLVRGGLVPSAYQYVPKSSESLPLSKIDIASADEDAGAAAETTTASEEYAHLVQSLAEDGSPAGLAALGDLFFHGHEAGGIRRDVDRAAELWRSAAAMGDANAAMALAFLLLGDVNETARKAREEAEKEKRNQQVSASGSASPSPAAAVADNGAPTEHADAPPSATSSQATRADGEAGRGGLFSVFSWSFWGYGGLEEGAGPLLGSPDAAGNAQGEFGGAPGDSLQGTGGSAFGDFFRRFGFWASEEEPRQARTHSAKAPKEEVAESASAEKTPSGRPRHPAEPYLKQVITDGDGAAPHLARYLAYRLGVEGFTNSTLAGQSLQQAADLGDSNAQMLLANAHMSGVRPSSISAHPSSFFPNGTDVSVALTYYTKAAEQGRLEAIFNVGILTIHGAGERLPVSASAAAAGFSETHSAASPSSSTSVNPPDSASASSSNTSTAAAPALSSVGAAPRSLRQRCVDAFGLLQKVAFSHPAVGALHALASHAFAKGDETGALLASVLLSEIGHLAGHVNAAGLWPRVTRRRAELVARLQAALGLRQGEGGAEGGGKGPGGESSGGGSAEKASQACTRVASEAVPARGFLLPQHVYHDAPEESVFHTLRDGVAVASPASAFFPAEAVPHQAERGRPAAEAKNAAPSNAAANSCDLTIPENALEVHLHHLRVSEFLRCWAQPPGAHWLSGLVERFPFLRRSLTPRDALAEEEIAGDASLFDQEKEGSVCAFYFLRRAAVAGDTTSMLEVSRAYLDDATALESALEQVRFAFSTTPAASVLRALPVEARIQVLGKQASGSEPSAPAAAPFSGSMEGGAGVATPNKEGLGWFLMPLWVTKLFTDAAEADRRAAFLWRSAASKQKDGRGLLELGEALEYGEGVRRNRCEAYKIYWRLATDPQHAPASRAIGWLLLARATGTWLCRRIGGLGVPFLSGASSPVDRGADASGSGGVSSPSYGVPGTEELTAQRQEAGGDREEGAPAADDDDPSPIACIRELRSSEQAASGRQAYIWNRLLLVFFLLLLASLLGVLTAVHARRLTSGAAPTSAADRGDEASVPFFDLAASLGGDPTVSTSPVSGATESFTGPGLSESESGSEDASTLHRRSPQAGSLEDEGGSSDGSPQSHWTSTRTAELAHEGESRSASVEESQVKDSEGAGEVATREKPAGDGDRGAAELRRRVVRREGVTGSQ
ncbi:Sel1 repeat-containing protein [Besnoitia besnoiti]|uniref:Sel1 repeat-containing protein n=1 Tax=Besnoitia besnoiti TaxID=94643 RepID=A0A2A9MPY0_BESBE|nr:Sel1 repeat-containing protein [Besnoitia besnoiti]PFH38466.1 Sel1 repeat-containing protein [Besnoitia besnoiti]